MHTRETIQSPEFSASEIEKLKGYFEQNKKYHQLINEELTAVLQDDPFWGPLMRLSTPEQTKAQNERSLELQRAAIYEGKWQEYTDDLITQGRTYARMNVTYSDWYGIIRLYKDHLMKYIKTDFQKVEDAILFIEGLTLMLDYAMYGIAEAYFQEKNAIIKDKVEEIKQINTSLEMKVEQRTVDLQNINKELESFSYSVSHDLRGPLRAISGFTQILAEEIGENLSEGAKDAMEEITTNATKMGMLIDDLLEFSRLGKKQVAKVDIGMNDLIKAAIDEVKKTNKKINFHVGELGHASGDYGMIRQVVVNLLSNAVKYSGKNTEPTIEIGSFKQNGNAGFYVKDNGVGFDMAYYDKLFGVFQRLHRADEFEGTGVGLAIVQRIITKHSGKVWAEAKVNEGATFYFSLPLN